MDLQEQLAEIHRGIDGLAAQAAKERDDRLRGLQLAARALRQAESPAQWVQILADAAAPLAERICFFRVEDGMLRPEAARGMEIVTGEIALADAPAFRQTVDSKEPVVSLFAPSQLSEQIAGSAPLRTRAYLYPLVGRTRVLGVMLAAGETVPDGYALEVLLSLAAAALDLREGKSSTLIGLAAPAPAAVRPASAAAFARATVARWILEHGDRVSAGRTNRDLYGALHELMDEAKHSIAAQFPGAEGLLHREMVARLAGGDAKLMGPQYAGGARA